MKSLEFGIAIITALCVGFVLGYNYYARINSRKPEHIMVLYENGYLYGTFAGIKKCRNPNFDWKKEWRSDSLSMLKQLELTK